MEMMIVLLMVIPLSTPAQAATNIDHPIRIQYPNTQTNYIRGIMETARKYFTLKKKAKADKSTEADKPVVAQKTIDRSREIIITHGSYVPGTPTQSANSYMSSSPNSGRHCTPYMNHWASGSPYTMSTTAEFRCFDIPREARLRESIKELYVHYFGKYGARQDSPHEPDDGSRTEFLGISISRRNTSHGVCYRLTRRPSRSTGPKKVEPSPPLCMHVKSIPYERTKPALSQARTNAPRMLGRMSFFGGKYLSNFRGKLFNIGCLWNEGVSE
ncbi:hypothetical protein F4860DRAFT_215258 [Xylaria cubensis]|nr:hypothetical protein F4860DRAFT_215258 [Xylaria cubensis]